MSCQLNLQCDAAIVIQSDRIGADVNAIAAQILSRPQIKRTIVQRTHDRCSTNEAVGKRPPRCGQSACVANTSPERVW